MRRRASILLAALLVAAVGRAHDGPRIWIGDVCGEVVTFASDNDVDPTRYPPRRLFVTDLAPFFGVYTTQFPGFEVRQDGGDVASSTTFGFDIRGPALIYDAVTGAFLTTQALFGPPQPGPVPQLALSQGSNLRVTADGFVAGFEFFTFFQVGDHAHLSYTLLGDGTNPVDGPDGVYALALQLTGDGLATSAPFYLLVRKDVPAGDPLYLAARAVAEQTLAVPADLDLDVDLDLHDVAPLQTCFTGPEGGPLACPCVRVDFDGDADVDFTDVSEVVPRMTGPGN